MSGTTDTFNVQFAGFDKPAYNPGDTITGSITGADVLTTVQAMPLGEIDVTVQAADGATSVLKVPAGSAQAMLTTTTPESVKIIGIKDNGPNAQNWTINQDGMSFSAVVPATPPAAS